MNIRPFFRVFLLVFTLCVSLMLPIVPVFSATTASDSTATLSPDPGDKPPDPGDKPPQKVQKVFVGVFLNRVVNLDLKQNTYWMDVYLWFRWKGDIDPTETYEFMNTFEKWGETNISEKEEVSELANGWKYKEFHIETQLHNPFHFAPYPLDKQTLSLRLEDKSHNDTIIQYVPDAGNSSFNPDIFIPGWKPDSYKVWQDTHIYPTNFGVIGQKKEGYSRINADLVISRHPQHLHLFKLFLPVAIILVMVFVVFFIPISFFESRVEIAITGLLSLIALQMVLNETLPPVGYLTLTDKIYNFSYFMVMCSLIETVTIYFFFKRNEQLSRQMDRFAAMAMMITTPVVFWLFFTVFRG